MVVGRSCHFVNKTIPVMWQHPSKLKTFYWMLALLQTQDICHTSAQPGKRTIRSPMDTPAYWNFFRIYPCPICLYFVAHHFTYLHFILNFQPGRRTVRPPRVSSWFKWFLSICLCQNMFLVCVLLIICMHGILLYLCPISFLQPLRHETSFFAIPRQIFFYIAIFMPPSYQAYCGLQIRFPHIFDVM